jgi:hypothetical protein
VQGVPPALDDLVAELMARDPSKRLASAREVRHRLAAICSELGQQPLAPSGPPPPVPLLASPPEASVVPAPTRRRAFVAIAVLAVGAIVVALAAIAAR